MSGIYLLIAVTIMYAGYNLFIKVAGGHVPASATTTISATICIQLAALATSAVFYSLLAVRGGHVFALSTASYLWAAVAGICIGGAEIGYLYLFGGLAGAKPMAANVAIPTIVSGTIVIAMLFSFFVLDEKLLWNQAFGSFLIVSGIILFFVNGHTTV